MSSTAALSAKYSVNDLAELEALPWEEEIAKLEEIMKRERERAVELERQDRELDKMEELMQAFINAYPNPQPPPASE